MKRITLPIIFYGCFYLIANAQVEFKINQELISKFNSNIYFDSVEKIEERVNDLQELSDPEKIEFLGHALTRLADSPRYHSANRFDVYRKAQAEILKISGHAQYFAEKVEWMRENYDRGYYDMRRGFEISERLKHMPSPETIQVLGEMLEDDRDILDEPFDTDAGSVGVWTNSYYAAEALEKIGLRDPPIERIAPTGPVPYAEGDTVEDYKSAKLKTLIDHREDVVGTSRQWYSQVLAGDRSFSFKGQDVQYRFLRDGTWATLPIADPPDDYSPPSRLFESRKREKFEPVVREGSRNIKWVAWLFVSLASFLVFGAIIWWWKSKRHRDFF